MWERLLTLVRAGQGGGEGLIERGCKPLLEGGEQRARVVERLVEPAHLERNGQQRQPRRPVHVVNDLRPAPVFERLAAVHLGAMQVAGAPGEPGHVGVCRAQAITEVVGGGERQRPGAVLTHLIDHPPPPRDDAQTCQAARLDLDITGALGKRETDLQVGLSGGRVAVHQLVQPGAPARERHQTRLVTRLGQPDRRFDTIGYAWRGGGPACP